MVAASNFIYITLYYKVQQILLQNATAVLFQNVTKVRYKMRKFFLEIATFITKCIDFITKCNSYCKLGRLL